jgi:hypothetical protein
MRMQELAREDIEKQAALTEIAAHLRGAAAEISGPTGAELAALAAAAEAGHWPTADALAGALARAAAERAGLAAPEAGGEDLTRKVAAVLTAEPAASRPGALRELLLSLSLAVTLSHFFSRLDARRVRRDATAGPAGPGESG